MYGAGQKPGTFQRSFIDVAISHLVMQDVQRIAADLCCQGKFAFEQAADNPRVSSAHEEAKQKTGQPEESQQE